MLPLWKKEYRDPKPNKSTAFIVKNGEVLLEKWITTFEGKRNPIRNFSSEELMQATNNYDKNNVARDDNCFKLYKGFLQDRQISIMKFKSNSDHTFDVCINHIVFASQMCHKHILKLIGCCVDTRIPILVFESLVKYGTLRDHIHSHHQPHFESLSWRQRLKITMEMANAFAYLHVGFPRPIVYSFISPSHILLDEHYVPKLFEFSYAECVPEGETQIKDANIRGVIGFIAPEHSRGVLNEKCDVFGFGALLVELFTGRSIPDCLSYHALNSNSCEPKYEEYCKLKSVVETKAETERKERKGESNSETKYEHWLRNFVKKINEYNRSIEAVDPIIVGDGPGPATEQQMKAFVELAVKFLSPSPEDRPTMIDVAKKLGQLYVSVDHATDSSS